MEQRIILRLPVRPADLPRRGQRGPASQSTAVGRGRRAARPGCRTPGIECRGGAPLAHDGKRAETADPPLGTSSGLAAGAVLDEPLSTLTCFCRSTSAARPQPRSVDRQGDRRGQRPRWRQARYFRQSTTVHERDSGNRLEHGSEAPIVVSRRRHVGEAARPDG